VPGRYPELTAWAARMHRQGALLCSACSGVFLLAETGLFDGHDSTVHWAYADVFARTFPAVPLRPEQVLVVSGDREQLVTSGASMTWHDLVLYLIARHAGAVAAQAVARMFALQWHHDGLAPYIVFHGRMDHGDAAIADAQSWLSTHFAVGSPVEEMVRRSGLPERTFKRRFTEATGFARSIMCSGCGSRMPSGGWSEPMPRPTRSAGRSAMRTPPFSAGCSNAQLASHQALIVDAFKSLVLPVRVAGSAGISPSAGKPCWHEWRWRTRLSEVHTLCTPGGRVRLNPAKLAPGSFRTLCASCSTCPNA
jgi:hypothetical protein